MPYLYTNSNYAAGDYYNGTMNNYGYAAGSIFSWVADRVKGAVGGFIKGGPLGAIGGAISGPPKVQEVKALPVSLAPMQVPQLPVPGTTPGAVPVPGVKGTIQRALPGGASGYMSGAGYGAPAGYHWNKSYSYARGLPAGSFLVKNRSMNPGNASSLRRAIRREKAFVGLARRVLRGSGYKIARSGVGVGRKTTRKR